MKSPNIISVLAGLILCISPPTFGQEPDSSVSPDSVSTEEPERPVEKKRNNYLFPGKRGFLNRIQITGGQMTLPFKIRPKAETKSFRLTTDVTVGAYIGLTKQLSDKKNYRLIIPLAAGLTFVNLNDGNTTLDQPLVEAEVVPGLTWSTGIILQLEQYSLGLMFGKDYASEVGNQWNYHRRIWWSFGIGFAFFN